MNATWLFLFLLLLLPLRSSLSFAGMSPCRWRKIGKEGDSISVNDKKRLNVSKLLLYPSPSASSRVVGDLDRMESSGPDPNECREAGVGNYHTIHVTAGRPPHLVGLESLLSHVVVFVKKTPPNPDLA